MLKQTTDDVDKRHMIGISHVITALNTTAVGLYQSGTLKRMSMLTFSNECLC